MNLLIRKKDLHWIRARKRLHDEYQLCVFVQNLRTRCTIYFIWNTLDIWFIDPATRGIVESNTADWTITQELHYARSTESAYLSSFWTWLFYYAESARGSSLESKVHHACLRKTDCRVIVQRFLAEFNADLFCENKCSKWNRVWMYRLY